MKNYLYLSIAFFYLFTGTYSWCHSEKPHEWPIERSPDFIAKVYDEQDISKDKGEKSRVNKRKVEVANESYYQVSTPHDWNAPHDWDDDLYTQKESDSNGQESMPDVNEKTPKLIKIDLTKKPSNEEVKAAISKRRRNKFWPKKTIKISKPSKHNDDDDIPKLFETF